MSNNNGYYGDFGSWAEEEVAHTKYKEQQEQEPDVVPCYKCKGQMYQESSDPKLNICDNCKEVGDGK